MKVTTLDGGLAVRVPEDVVADLGLKEGDEVDIRIVAPAARVVTEEEREAALERLKRFRGRLPADYTFDREEANAR